MSTLVYGASIRGNGHYRTGTECQDSTSFCEKDFKNGKIKVIALSDGHGESTCQRSAIGASVATLIAREELYKCVLKITPTLDELDTLNEIINNPPRGIRGEGKGAELSQIKDRVTHLSSQISKSLDEVKSKIIDKWQGAVFKDFSEKPIAIANAEITEISGDERKTAALSAYASREGNVLTLARQDLRAGAQKQITENPYILYGATLSACAQYKDHIFLIKLGDGNITVLDNDGGAHEPIKDKPEEIANATESLCQKNAKELMRCEHLKCQAKIIMMCTDGVANALEGDDSLCELANILYESVKNEPRELRREFRSFLRKFSSATDDDATICFIANGIEKYSYEAIRNTEDWDEDEAELKALYKKAPSYSLNQDCSLTWENDRVAKIENSGKQSLVLLACTLTTLSLKNGAIKADTEKEKYLVLSQEDRAITLANIDEKLYNELIAE